MRGQWRRDPIGVRHALCTILITRDVTERSARRSCAKQSRAVEQSPASIVITNPPGTIEYVNPKLRP